MLTAVVTRGVTGFDVAFHPTADDGGHSQDMTFEESLDFCEFPFEEEEFAEQYESTGYPCEKGPSPIVPEVKELAWGAGSFIVFLLLMRLFLYPRLRKGMDARYAKVEDGLAQADAARAAARAEVTEYEAALATVRAEAAERVNVARATLSSEREVRLNEVNAEIAAKREAAMAEARAAREAAEADVRSAVVDVTSTVLEKAIGRVPAEQVDAAVADVMNAEVRS